MTHWYEQETFWKDTYNIMFPENKFTEAEREATQILKLTDYQNGKILDLCCGPGRHSIAFAKLKTPIIGVDKSCFLLQKAIDRANKNNLSIDFINQDMRNYLNPEKYELVLSMLMSFGYFKNNSDDVKVAKMIYENLVKNGRCVIDLLGKEHIMNVYAKERFFESESGEKIFCHHTIIDDWTKIRYQLVVVKGTHAHYYEFYHNIYSGKELKDLLLFVGFREVKLYGNLDGSPYNHEANRLIAVGYK